MAEHWIERRLTYGFGVNQGLSIVGRESFGDLQRRVERESMGPVTVTNREVRSVSVGSWREARAPHQHEGWQIQPKPDGGRYCAACGEDVDE